uniref:uncharacterized protein isoform X2 n=1 Tax=Pristiophorus japonicus TaxID=55135 RepID=UPI00398EFBDF
MRARGPRTLVWALLAVWLVWLAETLDVNIFARPKNVLVNDDVSLECKISGYKAPTLDLTNVGVQWLFGSIENRTPIYVFNGGAHFPKRTGAKMSDTELQKGDASLHLPNIQFNEEGEYTCVVFVTPDKIEKSSEMQVSAQPVVRLSTQHITILTGTEGSVRCDATGFYPLEHELIWEKLSKDNVTRITNICTSSPIPNSDGTFNVSSRLRIEPTMDDDNNKYRCIMNHRSHPDGYLLVTELTVQEPVKLSSTRAIAASICVTLLLCALLLGAAVLYFKYLKKATPKITDVSVSPNIRHLEESIIHCQITGFRPKEIGIDLFLKRKEDQNTNKICSWNSQNMITKNQEGAKHNGKLEEVTLLMEDYKPDELFKSLEPEYEINSNGTFNLKCNIKMYPNVYNDNGAELTIEVKHETLASPIKESVKLDIKGVPPKISKIVVPPHTNHNEVVALTCPISGFKPRPLIIIWQRIRKNNELEEIIRLDQSQGTIFAGDKGKKSKYKHYISETEYDDKTYNITSVLVIVLDLLQDQDTKYICKVQHECTGSDQEEEVILKIRATPKLDTITYEEEKPVAGEVLTLKCPIRSFYPEEITVTWLKNGEKMTEASEVSETTLGNDNLYYLTSSVKIVPTRADVKKKYTCQVEHESLTEPMETDWVLSKLVSMPKVEAIKSDPLYPEVGQRVTLSCKAYGFFPSDHQIFWFKAFEKTNDGVETEGSKLDEVTGLFSVTSKRTFKPTDEDNGNEFKMQILHSETSNKPVSSSYLLKMKGIPSVEDIKCDPPDPMYGTDLTLICNISNFSPKEISATWMQKGEMIFKGIKHGEPKREENGCYRLSSRLQLIPTARDLFQEFSFHVNHAKLKKPIVKKAMLPLPAFSPNLSDIKTDPELPAVNQDTTCSISLTSYAPAEVTVKWFKNGKPCSNVTNTPPVIADDCLFSSITSTQFIATKNDHDCFVSCEVVHKATREIQEKKFKLLLKDCAKNEDEIGAINGDDAIYSNIEKDDDNFDEVSRITCQTKSPKAGQPVTLSCTVTGSTMAESRFTWFKSVYPIEDQSCIETTPFATGTGFTTVLTYLLAQTDNNCRFQIDVATEMEPVSRYFTLQLS